MTLLTPTTLDISIHHRVAVVWMAREKVRNAFNETMIAELTAAFSRLGADDGVRAIVLAARGPAFCAGADLEWMRRMSSYSLDENRRDARALADMLHTIYTCPKPTLARVHGDAYAGGMGLVAACDMAFAANTASFCLSETRLGLVPATIAPYVIRAMGAQAARRYFLTAERFEATEAFRVGLVHDITAPDQLDAAVNLTLGQLMATGPQAVRAAKQLVRNVAGRALDEQLLAETAELIARIRSSDEGREGIASFLGKRKSKWLADYEAERVQEDSPDHRPGGA
jgi:methylglutaconyl-CoA hydratase